LSDENPAGQLLLEVKKIHYCHLCIVWKCEPDRHGVGNMVSAAFIKNIALCGIAISAGVVIGLLAAWFKHLRDDEQD
jgi:hypothetical protein